MLKMVTFGVIGDKRLHCEGCERRVERMLKTLEGVRQVRASAGNQQIEVLFETPALDANLIAQRIGKAGYEVKVSNDPIKGEEPASLAAKPSKNKGWIRSLALIPGAALPLLPSATCPLCLAAYGGILSALGLGFLANKRVLDPLIVVFLAVGIFSMAFSMRSHRHSGPLLLAIIGAAAVVAGRLIWNAPAALYIGVGLFAGASVWNLWLKRARVVPLVQIAKSPRTT